MAFSTNKIQCLKRKSTRGNFKIQANLIPKFTKVFYKFSKFNLHTPQK